VLISSIKFGNFTWNGQVNLNKLNQHYVEKYILFIIDVIQNNKSFTIIQQLNKTILFIIDIIQNNKSFMIIQQLNKTVHKHCCTLQAYVSDTHKILFYL
jgi:hypothetical protein